MLEVHGVSKRFGGVVALNQCSLMIESGKVTALVGPNGAGKTTLFDIISGLIPADEGEVILNETRSGTHVLTHLRPDQIANLGICRTWQHVRLFRSLTIFDHLLMVSDNDDTKLWKQLVRGKRVDSELNSSFVNHLAHFGVDRPLKTVVSELSYGQRKLLQLAMVTLRPHTMLLLDEPVAGVNKIVQQKIEELLLSFRKQGETVVVIEHDMEFVRKLADHVVVMDAGKVLLEGKPEETLRDRRVLEAYLGE